MKNQTTVINKKASLGDKLLDKFIAFFLTNTYGEPLEVTKARNMMALRDKKN